MSTPPIVLVPGFWLGAWAWDDVVAALRADGHEATALTLPGLESMEADRSTIGLSQHVQAICDAVTAAGCIHKELAERFVRANVISYTDFEAHHYSEKECRAKGLERTEGKHYVVQDADVVHILASS